MNQGYSLRAAAKIVGIAPTTFEGYKKRGIVTPDVADKKGEFSLFSEAQIECAKAYRAANPPKTKKQNPGNTSDNLFDEHAPNETITAAQVGYNSPADEQSISSFEDIPTSAQEPRECVSEGADDIQPDLPENPYAAIDLPDNQGEVDSDVGDNDLEEKETPAPVVDFSTYKTILLHAEKFHGGQQTFADVLKNDLRANLNVEGSALIDELKENPDDVNFLDRVRNFLAKIPIVVVKENGLKYRLIEGLRDLELINDAPADNTLDTGNDLKEKETLAPMNEAPVIESPPFFNPAVVLLEEKTLRELADEGREFFSRGDDCLKQGALYYVEGGRRLVEAKRRLKHGQWQEWLKANFSFSQDTAANYMKLAERFGGAKSETFQIFKPAVLIKMLALPAGDEDAFIEAQAAAGKPVEDLTAREVQKAVKEWNQQQEAGEIETFSSSEKTTPSDASPVVEDNHSKIAALVALDYEEENLPDEEPKKLPPIAHNRNSTTDWHTPIEYIEAAREVLGTIDLDPASSELANQTVKAKQFFTADDDGLNHEWRGRIWLNPPFNKDKSKGATIDQFVDKLIASSFEAAIILVDNATETRWFRKLADNSSAIVFTTGRINFFKGGIQEAGSPTRGQTFFYFGSAVNRFYATFQQFGWCAQKIVPPIIEAASGDSDDASNDEDNQS